MKAEDLQIGDWVYFCHHDEWDSKTVCKVSLLSKDNTGFIEGTFKTKVNKKGFIQVEAIDGFQFWKIQEGINIEPIPLTSEILEKNGFEHEHNIGFVCEDYNTSNKIIVDMWDNTLKVIHNYDTVYHHTYYRFIDVHELQHLLKFCGIEKEIIL